MAFFVFLGLSNESLSFGNTFCLFWRQPCLIEGVITSTDGKFFQVFTKPASSTPANIVLSSSPSSSSSELLSPATTSGCQKQLHAASLHPPHCPRCPGWKHRTVLSFIYLHADPLFHWIQTCQGMTTASITVEFRLQRPAVFCVTVHFGGQPQDILVWRQVTT